MIRAKILVGFSLALILLLPSLHVSQVLATSIFSDGFESGDFSAWTTTFQNVATISVTSGSAHSGTYKATISGLQYSGDYAFVSKTLPSTYVDLYARAYVQIDSKPSTSQFYDMGIDIDGTTAGVGYSLISKPIFNPNTNQWGIRVYTGGTYVTYYESGTSTVNAGEWYCVEQRTYVDSNGFVTLWVDGVLKLNQTGFSTNEHGSAQYAFAGWRWIESNLASSLTEYVDDFVVDTSYIGPESTSPPTISILSPGNTTYSTAAVPLTFTTNETALWMGYSLDEQTNVTVTSNTTITGLSDGSHLVTVYANNTAGIMGSSETVHFTVESTSQITFNQTGISTDFTDTVVTIDGANYNVTDLPASFNWTVGSTHTFDFQSPLIANTNTKQYVWDSTIGLSSLQSDTITVAAHGSIIGNYKTQYYLNMTSNPPGTTTPSGSGWYDNGTYASISTPQYVPGGSRYNFTGWTTEDISEINDPSSTSTAVLIDKAKTVTANYLLQEQVTFAQSGVNSDFTGTIVTIDGTDYNISNLPASFWWDSNSAHTFSFSSPLVVNASEQYNWTSTSGLTALQTGSLSVTGSGSVTGNYAVASIYQHDVAVTNIASSKTVVGQGLNASINVTVANQGNFTETFNVTAFANATIIGTENVALPAGSSMTVTLTWNTTGLAYGNYTLSAYALPVPGETNTTNNNFTGGWVYVSIIGDITGGTSNLLDFVPDGKVDMKDIGVVARFFGQNVPPAPSNCDITGPTAGLPDGKIDMRDIGLVARHFGEHA